MSGSVHRATASVQTGLGLGLGPGGFEDLPTTTALAKTNSPGTGALTLPGKKTLVLLGIGIQAIRGTTLPKPSKQARGSDVDVYFRRLARQQCAWCRDSWSLPLRNCSILDEGTV